jgi:hypothetical protein
VLLSAMRISLTQEYFSQTRAVMGAETGGKGGGQRHGAETWGKTGGNSLVVAYGSWVALVPTT